MDTDVSEIAGGIYRLSTFVPDIAPPAGFTFNQFLVDADEPLLFHCGPRAMFGSVAAAVARVMPVERIRWIGFGHVEADECGAMNAWLAAAPRAQVAHGMTACAVSLNDLADRAPKALADGSVIDLGGKRIRYIDTPHVPHGWEAGLLFDETTATLFCGDLLTQLGGGAPLGGDDIVEAAIAAEEGFQASALTPATAPTIRKLAALRPRTLAVMHGASYAGDGQAVLARLADYYASRFATAAAAAGRG